MKADREQRAAILAAIERGELELVDAVRRLRRSSGLSQQEYARLIGLSLRVYVAFEQRQGNPTVRTLAKILMPFGLELTLRRKSSLIPADRHDPQFPAGSENLICGKLP